jgi:hypothetical protein
MGELSHDLVYCRADFCFSMGIYGFISVILIYFGDFVVTGKIGFAPPRKTSPMTKLYSSGPTKNWPFSRKTRQSVGFTFARGWNSGFNWFQRVLAGDTF